MERYPIHSTIHPASLLPGEKIINDKLGQNVHEAHETRSKRISRRHKGEQGPIKVAHNARMLEQNSSEIEN
jgi:hypothetical protein